MSMGAAVELFSNSLRYIEPGKSNQFSFAAASGSLMNAKLSAGAPRDYCLTDEYINSGPGLFSVSQKMLGQLSTAGLTIHLSRAVREKTGPSPVTSTLDKTSAQSGIRKAAVGMAVLALLTVQTRLASGPDSALRYLTRHAGGADQIGLLPGRQSERLCPGVRSPFAPAVALKEILADSKRSPALGSRANAVGIFPHTKRQEGKLGISDSRLAFRPQVLLTSISQDMLKKPGRCSSGTFNAYKGMLGAAVSNRAHCSPTSSHRQWLPNGIRRRLWPSMLSASGPRPAKSSGTNI